MSTSKMSLLTVVAACAAGCVDTSAAQPEVVDLPAAELSFQPSILDDDAAPSDGMVPVVAQFYHGNTFVKLASGTIACNGVALPWSDLGYSARIRVPSAGDSLVFVFTHSTATTQVTIRVPPRPVVMSPPSGAVLARSTNLAINYVPAISAGVRPGASDTMVGLSGSEQADSGVAYLDVTGLRAGAGTVGLSRRYLTTSAGSGFQGVIATYTIASADVDVTWQ